MPRFVLSGGNVGLLVRGTIDIDARLKVHVLRNGKISSVRSISFFRWTNASQHPGDPEAELGRIAIPASVKQRFEHVEVLCPTVILLGSKWAIVGDDAAIGHAVQSGAHLGVFDTASHATAYGNRLHLQQARGIKKKTRR